VKPTLRMKRKSKGDNRTRQRKRSKIKKNYVGKSLRLETVEIYGS
jgi:hypothetical protein